MRLPEGYKNGFLKATNSEFNDVFISSGQYEATATDVISVEGLVSSVDGKDEINMTRLDQIVKEIRSVCQESGVEKE